MKKLVSLFAFLMVGVLLLSSCQEKDPSVGKVFVRNYNNQLISDATVIIVGDKDSDPATPSYTDTLTTNASGFAAFDLSSLFERYDKEAEKVAYFDVLVKYEDKEVWSDESQNQKQLKARQHITQVITVYLPE
ncbi:hypothetical protein [Lishizhenia sp.]|uniref:hypothetical protein n=1 Tax=Lishizhenia sp. TaxID=2497594 RepID=UPI00299E6FFE|nr:hypothetical protein [Lishizhenia sp.]MDX1444800.1 hypothetical protein [Lishizhenia sp.]